MTVESDRPPPAGAGANVVSLVGGGATAAATSRSRSTPPTADARTALLDRLASEVASQWTQTYLSSLADEGRPIEGGWPGTMPEARMRMDEHARRLLSKHSMVALTTEELGQYTRLLYDEARRAWLRHRSPTSTRKARA